MVAQLLTDDERVALENLATFGPDRDLDRTLRGRLALYKLIDETPEGWKITAAGREALTAARLRREPAAHDGADREGEANRRSDGGRRYGRKARDTSWLG
jgi:hypothetical protein